MNDCNKTHTNVFITFTCEGDREKDHRYRNRNREKERGNERVRPKENRFTSK